MGSLHPLKVAWDYQQIVAREYLQPVGLIPS